MVENIKLRVKKSEALGIVAIVLKIYAIFLFFLGIAMNSNELIIETCIMAVVGAIFDFINDGELIISERGIKYEKIGFIQWDDIEFFDIKRNIMKIKIKDLRMKRIEINMKEDQMNVQNANKFINSKIKVANFERFMYKKEVSNVKNYKKL
jgi:hypothetical protein